jgi:hypothetical protein
VPVFLIALLSFASGACLAAGLLLSWRAPVTRIEIHDAPAPNVEAVAERVRRILYDAAWR